jgi:hypothetical protein
MATDIGELLVKLSADLKNLDSGLKTAKGELAGFQDYASSFAATLKKTLAFAGVAVGIYEIASAVKAFAQDAAMVGARTETLAISMYQVGKNADVSAQSLDLLVAKLQKLGITKQEAMLGATKFMAAGLDLSKLEELATRARDIAVVANVNTSEAFSRIIQGVISGESETLKRLMINVGNLDDLMKKWSAILGVNKEDIGSVTKANLMLGEVLEKTARFAGAASAADATVGKQLQSMARYAEEAKNALWPIFQPAFLAFVQEMTAGWKDLEKWARANTVRLEEWGKGFAEWVKWLATGIRDIGAFISENKKLITTFLELYVASKAAGWIAGLGASLKTTAVEVGILAALLGKLKVMVGGPWRIVITVALYGLYEAWNAIQKLRAQAGFTPQAGVVSGAIQEGRARDRTREGKELDAAKVLDADEATRRGLSPEKFLELQKEEQKRVIEGRYKKYTAPSVLPPVLPEHETPEERLAREAKEATKRAKDEEYKGAPKEKKGGGAKETIDNLLAPLLAMYKTKREADLQDAQNSLDLLKTTNDQKRAELEKDLAEGLIDGQTYYQRLQELQQQETAAAIAMIGKKREVQQKAYQDSLAEIDDDTKLSDEAKDIARQKLAADNRKALAKLDTEATQARFEGETRITNELKRQVDLKKQYQDTTATLNIDTAQLLGAITEQEATLMRLNLEWKKNREDALKAGLSPGDPFFAAGEKNLEAKKADTLYSGYATQISQGISSLADALMNGGQDLMNTANGIFKNLFNEALKPGLKELERMLVAGFKELFGAAGGGIASAVMGAVGLIGMMLTSGGGGSTFSPSGVQSAVTGSSPVRGIIAGDTSIPIAQISVSLSEALNPHLKELREINANTKGGMGGGGFGVTVTARDLQQRVKDGIREVMEEYFRDVYMQASRP